MVEVSDRITSLCSAPACCGVKSSSLTETLTSTGSSATVLTGTRPDTKSGAARGVTGGWEQPTAMATSAVSAGTREAVSFGRVIEPYPCSVKN